MDKKDRQDDAGQRSRFDVLDLCIFGGILLVGSGLAQVELWMGFVSSGLLLFLAAFIRSMMGD